MAAVVDKAQAEDLRENPREAPGALSTLDQVHSLRLSLLILVPFSPLPVELGTQN